jgi:hypothetical protein
MGRACSTGVENKKLNQIFVGHAHERRPFGRHHRIAEDNIKMHLTELVVKMPTVLKSLCMLSHSIRSDDYGD